MPEKADRPPMLAVEDLVKDFPSVRALDHVSLAFREGEVHGIVGENGAGKTTLMKILSGLYRPTEGRLIYEGQPVSVPTPAAANRLGIAMVHQDLTLVDELSVADNVFLGRELSKWGFVNRSETRRQTRRLLDRLGAEIEPGAKVGALSIAQQQMVEVARALSCEASVIIMDEPTAVLARPEAEKLFDLIARLKSQSVTVLYISHILPEVLRICDRITVLRDGQVVTTLSGDELGEGAAGEEELALLMVGRPMADHFPTRPQRGEEVVLNVQNLSVGERVRDVSFRVRAGEILGFAGLVGAGRTEMGEAIAGLRGRTAGRVLVDGVPLQPGRPREAVRSGLAYLPEDRRRCGLLTGRTVLENITIVSLRRYAHPLISPRAELRAAQREIRLGSR